MRKPSAKRSIIVVAGGTGGHVFPALALAEELRTQGHDIIFFTDPRGAKFMPVPQDFQQDFHNATPQKTNQESREPCAVFMKYQNDVDLDPDVRRPHSLRDEDCKLLPGNIVVRVLPLQSRRNPVKFYFSLVRCLLKGLSDVRRYRPKIVAGFGGYPALTWGLIAGLFRIPLIIHEQNAILGRTNRLLARWANCVALTFKSVSPAFGPHEMVTGTRTSTSTVTGVPVREAFKSVDYNSPKGQESFRLLVLGGSQGARIFGDVIPKAIQLLPKPLQERLEITQQCGIEDLDKVKRAYEGTGVKISIAPFFHHVAALLEASHLVIARAGASTIAEITTVGRPALFVPLPGARDDHQTANARTVVSAEGGWLFDQRTLTPERVASFLRRTLECPSILLLAAEGARREGHQGATQKLSKLVLACLAN